MTKTETRGRLQQLHPLPFDFGYAVERCPSCGRKLWRSPSSKCAAHAVYACQECFSAVQISEFAQQRRFSERTP